MELVLSSTSTYRQALLAQLGVPFRCRPPAIDETAIQGLGLDPRSLAERLALAKATSLRELEPGATIIGSDQVLDFEGRTLGKPHTAERAVETLCAMAGKRHTLVTALAVLHEGVSYTHTDLSHLQMRSLTREELARYVEADRPLDCAGGYKIESRGIALFEEIESADHTAIVGLPLVALVTILRKVGYEIP